jgi:hypothetical protein
MAMLRTLLNFVVAGALVGITAASFIGPRFLTWYNQPGQGKALCDCADNTRQTADQLIHYQLIGGGSGAGIGLVGGIAFAVMRRKKGAAQATPAAPKVS